MKSLPKEIFSWIKTIVVVFIVVTLVRTNLFFPVSVEGKSMYPTFYDGDYVIVWRRANPLSTFDNIVFRSSEDIYFIKRIIGLPGQNIRFENNQLYIDGVAVEEKHLEESQPPFPSTEDFNLQEICRYNDFDTCDVIPDGYYLVLGDNRLNSKDSRSMGLVSGEQIRGRVLANITSWWR